MCPMCLCVENESVNHIGTTCPELFGIGHIEEMQDYAGFIPT